MLFAFVKNLSRLFFISIFPSILGEKKKTMAMNCFISIANQCMVLKRIETSFFFFNQLSIFSTLEFQETVIFYLFVCLF